MSYEVKMKLKTSCEYFVRNSKENTMQYDSIDGHNKSVIAIFVNGTIPCSKGEWGETALHITVKGNPDISVVLLTYEEEANVDAFCDKRCMTIYLLKKGADHSLKDHHGKTALHYAAEEGSQDVCQILVSYGADVNCLTSEISDKRYNETPLHLAILYNETCVAKYLLKNGADHSLRDGFGKTALHNAALKGNLDVFKQLILNGAKINCLTSRNERPICLVLCRASYYIKKNTEFTKFKKCMAVVEYILENKAVYHPIITRDEYEGIVGIFLHHPFLDEAQKKIWFCRLYIDSNFFKEPLTLKSISRKVIRKHIDPANKLMT